MRPHIIPAILPTILLAHIAATGIPLHDMYLANTEGAVYHVNGLTLEATQVSQITIPDENPVLIDPEIQIEYLGNGRIAIALDNHIDILNINTGIQERAVSAADMYQGAVVASISGLAQLDDGTLLTSGVAVVSTAIKFAPRIYDPQTDTSYGTLRQGPAFLVDIHAIDGLMTVSSLSSEFGRVAFFDYDTDTEAQVFDVEFPILSFIENNGELFALSTDGQLYTFDLQTLEMSLQGTITGFDGIASSITIPTPSTLACVGVLSLAVSRRRR
jgi:hypothetical protein